MPRQVNRLSFGHTNFGSGLFAAANAAPAPRQVATNPVIESLAAIRVIVALLESRLAISRIPETTNP